MNRSEIRDRLDLNLRADTYRVVSRWESGHEDEHQFDSQSSFMAALDKIAGYIGYGNGNMRYRIVKISCCALDSGDILLVEEIASKERSERVKREEQEKKQWEYQREMADYNRYLELKGRWEGTGGPKAPK